MIETPRHVPTDGLDAVFYRLSTTDLYRLKAAVTAGRDATLDDFAAGVEPVSAVLAHWVRGAGTHNVHAIGDVLSGIVGVLLALYVVSEEPAPPDQLHEVIANAGSGAWHLMPLPRRADCFCGSGKKFKSCHGRAPA